MNVIFGVNTHILLHKSAQFTFVVNIFQLNIILTEKSHENMVTPKRSTIQHIWNGCRFDENVLLYRTGIIPATRRRNKSPHDPIINTELAFSEQRSFKCDTCGLGYRFCNEKSLYYYHYYFSFGCFVFSFVQL